MISAGENRVVRCIKEEEKKKVESSDSKSRLKTLETGELGYQRKGRIRH